MPDTVEATEETSLEAPDEALAPGETIGDDAAEEVVGAGTPIDEASADEAVAQETVDDIDATGGAVIEVSAKEAAQAPPTKGAATAAAKEKATQVAAEEGPPTEEAPKPVSPYDLPGDWYVIHSYSGYENKVKVNLETRINSMHMEDRIFEVHIPMEDVVEFKNGKKTTVNKKVFPGYILVRMTLDDDSWYAVRNTPGVTGFVAGNAQKPTPLSRREVERFLGVQKEEEKGKPRFKPDWEIGEQVRVVTGPFADFNGVIEEINIDQQKIVVLVNIFGRDTPVELGFDDIQKN